jgi:hypothetical protein
MKVLERMVQKIGDWQALEELDQKYNVIEAKYGVPAKRRYRAMMGQNSVDTLIVEREWESMAALEKAFDSMFEDPEWQAVSASTEGIIKSMQAELYFVL